MINLYFFILPNILHRTKLFKILHTVKEKDASSHSKVSFMSEWRMWKMLIYNQYLFFRLFDWRPEKKLEPSTRPKSERVVVLKHMFDPTEFEVSTENYYLIVKVI
jgi:hypothetical protein